MITSCALPAWTHAKADYYTEFWICYETLVRSARQATIARHVLNVILLLATCSSVAIVSQSRYLPAAPGTWKPWQFTAPPDHRRVLGARPAEVKELEAQLLRLNAIIKNMPGLTSPVGFSVETSGDLDLEMGRFSPRAGELALTARPLPASLNFGAYPVMEFGTGAAAKRDDRGETAQLLFFVNQLSQPLFSAANGTVPEFEKLDADVARLAAPRPDVLGFSRYEDTLVIRTAGADHRPLHSSACSKIARSCTPADARPTNACSNRSTRRRCWPGCSSRPASPPRRYLTRVSRLRL